MSETEPEDLDSVNPLRHQPHGVIGLILIFALLLGIAYVVSHRRGTPTRPTAASSPGSAEASQPPPAVDPTDPILDVAVSEPTEDSVYPDVGDPGVDSLHYGLVLNWQPATRTLDGVETLTLRATKDAGQFQLALGPALTVSEVLVDGTAVPFSRAKKELIITAPVSEGKRYQARISYRGTPQPVKAPSKRSDIGALGWNVTDSGETWTMQEPFGAYSWYPVNDQPSDKALYDFTMTVPAPMVGVANGKLLQRTDSPRGTTTEWQLDSPAAAYLVTAAFGDFQLSTTTSASGVPISYWYPTATPAALADLKQLEPALAWAENRLGPYPFSTLGIVAVASESAMETQTLITLGNTSYIRSPEVILHELIHQWYGDAVTPRDWRDVWMNEGLTTYLQGVYEADKDGLPINKKMADWRDFYVGMLHTAGPPGDYDAARFGDGNVYYGPALMWHQLRRDLGEKQFWALVRDWPQHAAEDLAGSADREEYVAWIEQTTGKELSAFFDSWIMGTTVPPSS